MTATFAATTSPAAQVTGDSAAAGAMSARPPAVLVLVRDLRWAGAPPVLDGWARASLSLRSEHPRAGAADGYLTVGKGARAAIPDGAGVGPVVPAGEGGLRLVDWGRLRAYDATLEHDGELGTLGQALTAAGRPWALVTSDPAAAAAVADHRGVVPRALDGGAAGVVRAMADGAEAMVAATDPVELPAVVTAAGPAACVVVASVSSPDESLHLGVLAASPPCGLGDKGLSSPSTHQSHLATLLDVTPTFLSRLDVVPPVALAGSVVRPSGPVSRAALVDRDRRAYTADRARTPLVWLFVSLTALGAVVAVKRPRARPAVAFALLAVPPASFAIMALPWWRWGGLGALAAGAVVVAVFGVSAAIIGRADVRLGVWALAALTAAIVGVDAMFGGRLEVDAPFGNSPVVAGRFYGVGNFASGLLAASLIVAVGLAVERWGRRAATPGAGALATGVVVGGAPWFGADVGGVLASVPAYLTLGMARRRWSVRLVVGVIAATAAVLALFVVADLARPSADRTHLARAITDGGLLDAMVNKARRALESVRSPICLVVVVGVGAVWAVRPRLDSPSLSAMAWALLVAGVVGSAVNDSGLVVAAAVTAVAWPTFVALAGTADVAPTGGPGARPPAVVDR